MAQPHDALMERCPHCGRRLELRQVAERGRAVVRSFAQCAAPACARWCTVTTTVRPLVPATGESIAALLAAQGFRHDERVHLGDADVVPLHRPDR